MRQQLPSISNDSNYLNAMFVLTTPGNLSLASNCTSANDLEPTPPPASLFEIILVSLVVAVLAIVTTGGNILVILSFKMDVQLQTVTNYFLISLSIADLTIGMVSMPLFSVYLLMRLWPLGSITCDVWLSLDYTMSNASVANLLLISFDRYFSVTRPLTYRAKRTTRRAVAMILVAWIVSALLWTPWIFAWPYIEGVRTVPHDKCYIQFLQTNKYVTIATAIAAFFLPVTIMAVLFSMIYRETEKRQKELVQLKGGQPLLKTPSVSSSLKQSNGVPPRGVRSWTSVLNCCSYSSDQNDAVASNGKGKRHSDAIGRCLSAQRNKPMRQQPMSDEVSETKFSLLLSRSKVQGKRISTFSCRRLLHDDDRDSPIRITAPCSPTPSIDQISRVFQTAASNDGGSRLRSSERLTAVRNPGNVSMFVDELVKSPEEPTISEGIQSSDTCISIIALSNTDATTGNTSIPAVCQSSLEVITDPDLEPAAAENRRPVLTMQKVVMQARIAARLTNAVRANRERKQHLEKKQDRKAAKTLSAILLAFVLTWTPYNVFTLVQVFCQDCVHPTLYDIGYWLCYINSTINPVCYALCNANFRRTYWHILTCRWYRSSVRKSSTAPSAKR